MESKFFFFFFVWKFIYGGLTSYMICCKDFFFLIINDSSYGFGFWVLLDFFNSSFDFHLRVFGLFGFWERKTGGKGDNLSFLKKNYYSAYGFGFWIYELLVCLVHEKK